MSVRPRADSGRDGHAEDDQRHEQNDSSACAGDVGRRHEQHHGDSQDGGRDTGHRETERSSSECLGISPVQRRLISHAAARRHCINVDTRTYR